MNFVFFVHEFRIFKILYPIFSFISPLNGNKTTVCPNWSDPTQVNLFETFFFDSTAVLLSLKTFWPLSKECFNNFEQEKVTAHRISNNRKFGLHCRWISVVHFMRWKHLWSHFSSWMLLVIRIVSFERGKKSFHFNLLLNFASSPPTTKWKKHFTLNFGWNVVWIAVSIDTAILHTKLCSKPRTFFSSKSQTEDFSCLQQWSFLQTEMFRGECMLLNSER